VPAITSHCTSSHFNAGASSSPLAKKHATSEKQTVPDGHGAVDVACLQEAAKMIGNSAHCRFHLMLRNLNPMVVQNLNLGLPSFP
jgi:hypothetical protein